MPLGQLLQTILDPLPEDLRVLLQPVLLDHVEDGQARRHADRVSAEGIEVNTLGHRLGDLHPRRNGAKRYAIANALRHSHEVRDDVEVLESPVVIAGAAKTGLHFVADAESAALPRDRIRFAQISARAVGGPAYALNRLGDERGDLSRCGVANCFPNLRGALAGDFLWRAAERAAIRIRTGYVMDAERTWDRVLPGVVGRQTHRARAAAVITVAQRYDISVAGIEPRHGNGEIIRLAAIIDEVGDVQTFRHLRRQLLRQQRHVRMEIDRRRVL